MIYIIAPFNFSSGGPELVHQLAFILKNKLKKKVAMYYFPKAKNPVHRDFKKYKIKFVDNIVDDEKNILIIPEVYSNLKIALKYKKIKKIMWWLSVDNYLNSKFRNQYNRFLRSLIKLPYFLIYLFNFVTFYKFGLFTQKDYLYFFYRFINLNTSSEIKQINIHLCQSYYALNFVKNKISNKSIFMLQDFHKKIFLNENKNLNKIIKLKKNIICYNATKANDFMKRIISYNKGKIFFPLKNLSPTQMVEALKASKIYIDFGFHPGKDRPPREAALLGNCIITNFKGSAKFFKDLPFNNKFKFKEKYENLKLISELIDNIFTDYKNKLNEFKNYRKCILSEKQIFLNQLDRIKHIFK